MRAVAVVGLVAVLLVGAWGIIQIAFYIPTLFDTTTSTTITQTTQTNTLSTTVSTSTATQLPLVPETLSLMAPNIITSGQAFLLLWNHQGETGAYAYQVSYSCAANLSAKTLVPTGTYKEVACNTPFDFIDATSSMPLALIVVGQKQATTSLVIFAQRLADGTVTAVASSTTVVLPALHASAATPTNTSATTTTAKATPVTTAKPATSSKRASLSGFPDFTVQILSVTPTSANTNSALGPVHYTAQFVIQNIGTNVTPANWAFDAIIPLNSPYTYHSPMQQKLYPGDKIVYTLGFDIPLNNNQYFAQHQDIFTVIADPQNIAQENNEQNNIASLPLPVY